MPCVSDHIANAKHNRSAVGVLDARGPSYADWVIVLYYYVIIHLIEAALADRGEHSQDHRDRRDRLERQFGRNWRQKYQHLGDITRELRYQCKKPDQKYLNTVMSRAVGPFLKYFCRILQAHDPAGDLTRELLPT